MYGEPKSSIDTYTESDYLEIPHRPAMYMDGVSTGISSLGILDDLQPRRMK